jgi:hypothetical protein
MRKIKHHYEPILTIPNLEAGQIIKWKDKLWYYQGYQFNQSIDIGTAYTTIHLIDFWTKEEERVWPEILYELEIVDELPDSESHLKDGLNKLGF